MARELDKHLDNYTIFDLGDKSLPPVSVFRKIEDSDTNVVVAIGLRAAISATSMAGVPVVFCQVFNYQDHGLITDNRCGVREKPFSLSAPSRSSGFRVPVTFVACAARDSIPDETSSS